MGGWPESFESAEWLGRVHRPEAVALWLVIHHVHLALPSLPLCFLFWRRITSHTNQPKHFPVSRFRAWQVVDCSLNNQICQ
ncbi:hypothetical protein BJY00DRAFT_210865 [Aspergillus carlsbadensis]|nr:hypothetical protein BJY00DRAFT_210865 [Aspergillus carlsbadensis]